MFVRLECFVKRRFKEHVMNCPMLHFYSTLKKWNLNILVWNETWDSFLRESKEKMKRCFFQISETDIFLGFAELSILLLRYS